MPRADSPDIRVATTADEMASVHAVRREVFIEEQNVPEADEWDELDATSLHLLALDRDGAPLGTARLIHGPQALAITGRPDTVLLGRLAVHKRARGTGLGAALVRAVEQQGRALGATELELHAQVHALGFYERLGYTAHGPVYPDGGIPHRTMTRSLAG